MNAPVPLVLKQIVEAPRDVRDLGGRGVAQLCQHGTILNRALFVGRLVG